MNEAGRFVDFAVWHSIYTRCQNNQNKEEEATQVLAMTEVTIETGFL